MAFEYGLFETLMKHIHTTGGFDKELELTLLKQKYTIYYLEDALVYDEKVQQPKAFRDQRTRWIAAQLKYLKRYVFSGVQELITKGNIDFFDKVFQLVLLPRIVLLGLLALLCIVTLVLGEWLFLGVSAGILLGLLITLWISIPTYLLNKISWKEIASLPILFFHFIVSFTRIGHARKKFIHTPHGKIK
jgi:cellulose synthase/poly-beta-1,6-N-acetylglucosamine synthase-like glycosyltransferase